jgi:cell migration-inducing and hyaluronan-binding protein
LLRDQGVIFQLSNYANNQRLFNIYDGPSFEDSNAFFDIKRTFIDGCKQGQGSCSDNASMYGRVPLMPYDNDAGKCYLPNAAIAWKQPNGFYYPPAFHSSNLYFRKDVDIRHFVIEPRFDPNGKYAFQQWDDKTKENYCTFSLNNPQGTGGSFGNFSAIDRQTILNDDDGSLTGLIGTISVNEDDFFKAPTETLECESAETAKTSPYDYITTVVYPGCVEDGDCGGVCKSDNKPCALDRDCAKIPNVDNNCDLTGAFWGSDCGSSFCYGVPLYRQFLTKDESSNTKGQEIRMMGMNFFQRSNLTANHGVYYIDTTVSKDNQLKDLAPTGQKPTVNVFKGGETYYVLFLFAKPTTKQTYLIYVGTGLGFNPVTDVQRVNSSLKVNRPLPVQPGNWPTGWTRKWYDEKNGILEVTVDFGGNMFKNEFDTAKMDRCQPKSFCEWKGSVDKGSCICSKELDKSNHKLYQECKKPLGLAVDHQNTICDWAVKAVDCPTGGCYGFSFKLPQGFETPKDPLPPPVPCCFPMESADWNVNFSSAKEVVAGTCYDKSPPKPEFCTMPACSMGL